MALQKTFTRRGVPCNHVKIGYCEPDYTQRTISVHFALYFNAAAAVADPSNPVVPILAKLRLSGAKFDQYLSTAALAASTADDPFRAAIYAAAKVEPVICDDVPAAGRPTVFADALDV